MEALAYNADPGVVDHDVQATERRQGRFNGGLCCFAPCHIVVDENRTAADLRDQVGGRQVGAFVEAPWPRHSDDVADDNLGAGAREGHRDATADSRRGSSYDRHLPIQRTAHCSFLRFANLVFSEARSGALPSSTRGRAPVDRDGGAIDELRLVPCQERRCRSDVAGRAQTRERRRLAEPRGGLRILQRGAGHYGFNGAGHDRVHPDPVRSEVDGQLTR